MLVVNTIAVAVRGVPEPATIVAIRQTVQKTLSHLVGAWHVRVSASAERGRWDLHIRGGLAITWQPSWPLPIVWPSVLSAGFARSCTASFRRSRRRRGVQSW